MGDGERTDTEIWREHFDRHLRQVRRTRRMLRAVPHDPRCKFCNAPFKGVGGLLGRPFGRVPSRKNPRMCAICLEKGPPGGFEEDIGVLFADVRGFTALSETMSPGDVAELLNRFYATATRTVIDHEGLVDKLIGDEMMALFWSPLLDADLRVEMVAAAEGLLRGVGFGSQEGPWLDLGVGLAYGPAFVGNVGSEGVEDFTALGDAVNTAARLQGAAAGGQIVMSDEVYGAVADRYPDAERVELDLKGKSEPVAAHVVDLSGGRVPDEERPTWAERVVGRAGHDV